MLKKIYEILHDVMLCLTDLAARRVEKYGARYISFSIFSLINLACSFYWFRDAYDFNTSAVWLNISACLLSVSLAVQNMRPIASKRFVPLCWYMTVLVSLPVLSLHLFLICGGSLASVMNLVLSLIVSMMVLDFVACFVIYIVGAVFAFSISLCSGWSLSAMTVDTVPMSIVCAIVLYGGVAVVFSRNGDLVGRQRIEVLRAFGSAIAHEMRTPLSTISLLCKLIKKSEGNIEKIMTNVDKISVEVLNSLLIIDMMLVRLKKQSSDSHEADMQMLSIRSCVEDAIKRYPFSSADREKIVLEDGYDFEYLCCREYIVHVMFNLIQNSLYQIHTSNCGCITIKLYSEKDYHVLSFYDNATGIAAEMAQNLFHPMQSYKSFSVGLGLSFCKSVMESLGGTIHCRSAKGEFAEFILKFPKVK